MTVPTERIRNALVLGHTGVGKTALVEALLAEAGRATHGGVLDQDPEERERGHSLALGVASFEFDGHRLNLLDAPGGADVIGDAYPALLAADLALFVVDATVGIRPQHEQMWRVCEQLDVPRVLFLNKFDLDRARYQDRIDELRERHGDRIAPVHMPLGIHDEFDGVIDLLHGVAVEVVDGEPIEEPVPDERKEQADRNRQALVEAVVENDDELLERYLDGEEPSTEQLAELFAHGIAETGFFPVLVGSAATGVGIDLLLRFLIEECPSPAEAPHPLPHDGPTVAYVAKTFSDQYVGRINLLRILSGELHPDDHLVVQRTNEDQRLRQLVRLCGRDQSPVDSAAAGDLVAVVKLDGVATGDLLTSAGVDVEVDAPHAPQGFHRVVLHPASASDDDKMWLAFHRILQEDPSIRVDLDPVMGTRIVSFQGPAHVEVTVARLERKYGVHVTVEPAPIDFRETIRRPATGIGKHVKQSGGHGQYAIAHVELTPLPRGEGFAFTDDIKGGVIPNQYIPSVEKGILEAMQQGPLGGYPVVDVGARVFDGRYHSVDSSDAAFQMAGILAFRTAVEAADPILLEPVAAVELVVPEELTGAEMSDLSARRGRILGTEPAGPGRTRVQAHVPEAELTSFVAEFRALTSGAGEVTMRYDHHEEVPDAVAERLLEATPSARQSS
jgi:elongation factor G